jgi:hypothetical protein
MRSLAPALMATGLMAAILAPTAWGDEQRLLTFVFGPSSQEAAKQSARAAAAAAHHWLQTAGSDVEIRRAGSPDVQRLGGAASYKDLEKAFNDAALAAREADPPSFLMSLDSAAQAAALHPGARVVVAVLNSPPFSSEGERALEHLTEICQVGSVRVLVLDITEGSKRAPNAALSSLASKTGGMWIRQARGLEPNVLTAVEMTNKSAEEEAPAPVAVDAAIQSAKAAPPAAAAATSPAGSIPKFEIPVHIRFLRTSGSGSTTESIMDHEADFGETFTLSVMPGSAGGSLGAAGGGGSMELSYEPNDLHAPLQGLVTVESPLNALKFDTDDNAGTYQAHARLSATIKNAKGAIIWTGKRDVNVHGPIKRLDARREGSMYFMRGVTVAGKGPFTLEAKVEDLLGNTTGVTQTPLRVGRNARGLVASDALVVRPFKGSADKFEADQVLSYDGDALSPVLNPVFRAEQPVDLQMYLRLYPDIHGAPLDLSMEVLSEGHVVARMPLPFKGGLAQSAREGASSSIAGRSDNMYGGQAKEFPYLADLKGAKFPPGNYQAVISIRQGNSVIKRVVPFLVVGNAPVQVASAGGPKSSLTSRDDAEDATFVLPEIEPASIDSNGLKMAADEQKRLWDEAAKNAMGYLDHLPNFRCLQETHRFTASIKTPDQLKEADSFKDDLMYENGKERYQTIEVNGVKPENATTGTKQGIHSRNEFGSMLRGLFDPEVAASYKWAGRAMAMGVLCEVFDVAVSKDKTNFVMHYGGKREPVGYAGRVFIDEETGMVRRLTIQGGGLPKDYGLQSPALSLDYGMVRIGSEDYLLPLRSVLQLRHTKAFVRNETVFRGYRKFDAESEIKFQN